MKLDFLIVGSGIFGATFAQQCRENGKTCLVIEKQGQIGGLTHTSVERGITVHDYGAHCFHTNDAAIWKYVNRFAEFNQYRLQAKSCAGGLMFDFPPNKSTPCLRSELEHSYPINFEEVAIARVGRSVYETFYKGYTEKMWGVPAKSLPVSLFNRRPVRYNSWNTNYHDDIYQGVPIRGYTEMILNMLDGVKVELATDYLHDIPQWNKLATRIVYTGSLDALFEYQFGRLKYRTLDFKKEYFDIMDYQGCGVVNYPDATKPYTRKVEHKHFALPFATNGTIVTTETPRDTSPTDMPMYPMPDEDSRALHHKYIELAGAYPSLIIGGRIAEYQYWDMNQVIASALAKFKAVCDT